MFLGFIDPATKTSDTTQKDKKLKVFCFFLKMRDYPIKMTFVGVWYFLHNVWGVALPCDGRPGSQLLI